MHVCKRFKCVFGLWISAVEILEGFGGGFNAPFGDKINWGFGDIKPNEDDGSDGEKCGKPRDGSKNRN